MLCSTAAQHIVYPLGERQFARSTQFVHRSESLVNELQHQTVSTTAPYRRDHVILNTRTVELVLLSPAAACYTILYDPELMAA